MVLPRYIDCELSLNRDQHGLTSLQAQPWHTDLDSSQQFLIGLDTSSTRGNSRLVYLSLMPGLLAIAVWSMGHTKEKVEWIGPGYCYCPELAPALETQQPVRTREVVDLGGEPTATT